MTIYRHPSKKLNFQQLFTIELEKERILTGTLVYKACVDEAFVFIDKLISELLADLIGRLRFRTFERRDKWQFCFLKKST